MALILWDSAVQEKASDLHEDIWNVQFDDTITQCNTPTGWHHYISGSFARFTCSLCKRSWASKRVQVIFHFHLSSTTKKGTIKVRRFKQKCRRCAASQMEDANFSVDNIEVLVERLITKIRIRCYKEDLGDSNIPSRFTGRINGPHETLHCEACQQGVCSQAS